MNELVGALIEIYCGNVGAEYLHIENEQQKKWLRNKIEGEIVHNVVYFALCYYLQFLFDAMYTTDFTSIENHCFKNFLLYVWLTFPMNISIFGYFVIYRHMETGF